MSGISESYENCMQYEVEMTLLRLNMFVLESYTFVIFCWLQAYTIYFANKNQIKICS